MIIAWIYIQQICDVNKLVERVPVLCLLVNYAGGMGVGWYVWRHDAYRWISVLGGEGAGVWRMGVWVVWGTSCLTLESWSGGYHMRDTLFLYIVQLFVSSHFAHQIIKCTFIMHRHTSETYIWKTYVVIISRICILQICGVGKHVERVPVLCLLANYVGGELWRWSASCLGGLTFSNSDITESDQMCLC